MCIDYVAEETPDKQPPAPHPGGSQGGIVAHRNSVCISQSVTLGPRELSAGIQTFKSASGGLSASAGANEGL